MSHRVPCPKCGNSMWTSLIRVQNQQGVVMMYWRCIRCNHEWSEPQPAS